MVRTETSVFTVDGSTTHPDCSTMSTDRCLNTSRRTDPSPATDQGRHWLPGRLACYMLAVLAALSVLPVAAQDQDTTAPELRSVSINRVGLRLTYDEELDDDSEPDISAFTVTVNGASREVRTVVVIRTFVLVFLYSPVQAGETVTVSYTVPATNPVQDLSGNRAAAITNLPVSNNTPATAPPAPTNLTAQAGDRSVALTWTTSGNGGSSITKHQYQEKIESGLFGNWMNISNSAEGQTNANSYTVPNRTNGTTYTYKVRAVNAQGESTESNEDSARPTATVTSTAPPAPTNLTAQAGDAQVTLTWTTPGNGGSSITKHQYREKIESGEFGNWMNIPNSAEGQANANSYTVPNRTNGTTYTYKVRAVNAQGESTESNEDSARPTATVTSTAPPAPTNLTAQAGDAQVTLTWTTPGNGGSAITKHQYREKVGTGAFGNWTNIPNSAEGQTNANSYTVPNRTNGITYTFEVRAVNAQGEGTESNEDSARPTATVTSTAPPAPTNLTAQAGDRSVTLTWTTPGNGGSSITKHQYREKIESGLFGNWMNIPNSAEGQANANSYTVPDLTNGITYTFEVRAANAQGESTESNEDSATPAASPVLLPLIVTWPEEVKGTQHSSIWTSLTSMPPQTPQISVSGGQPYYTYNIDANGAPDGLEIDPLGTITGTPTGHGDFIVRVVVQDAGGQSVSHNLNITIRPALNVMSIAYKTVEQGKRITPIHLSASGGWDPYTYSISGAPSGISLSDDTSSDNNYNDLITGSPSQDGTFPITVTVTDDHGSTAEHRFKMSVYSIELAKLFSPILILTEHPSIDDRIVLFPEPVEIMGANSVANLWFYFFNTTGNGSIIHKYPASGWSLDLLGSYQSGYSDINFSQNKFASLPATLNYAGSHSSGTSDNFHVTTYFDYPGNDKVSWNNTYTGSGPKRGAAFPNTAYVHIFDKGDGNVVIQYYYFYPFNDWQNNHEGDWQNVNVIVNSFDPNMAQLIGVDYKFHGKGLTYSITGERVFNPQTRFVAPAEGGNHPVVYVGAGSHGAYPTGDNYAGAGAVGVDEGMTKSGIVLSTNVEDTNREVAQSYDLILLPNPDPDQPNKGLSPEMSWLGAITGWGTLWVDSAGSEFAQFLNQHSNSSPRGPFHNDTWNTSGTSGYDKDDVPYTEFQQFPIVQDVRWSGTINLIGDIVVYPGATLTIDAGTVIRAAPNRDIHGMKDANHVDIINYGEINASGSSLQPIVFRADTLIASAGDWYGIRNHDHLAMTHCTIQHSVVGLDLQGSQTLTDMTLSSNTYNTPLTITAIEDVTATQNGAITDIPVSASGGWEPYTYSTSDLPSGIVLDQNQNGFFITGTPTAVGGSDITVTVRDAVNDEASTTFDLFVSAATRPLEIEPIADVVATQDEAITPIQVKASGGGGAYTYSIASDPEGLIASDPDEDLGLSIDSNGRITGTPTVSGDFTIEVTVRDGAGSRDSPTEESRYFSMTVNAPTTVSTLTIAEIDDITVKISAVQTNNPITPIQASASGGQTPYSYSLSSNPATGAGLSINENSGQITGTPTQRGTFTLSVTVTDNASTTANEGFSIAVSLIGDFNGDGAVNESDFALFQAAFGFSQGDDGFNAEMDLNGDGTIDVADFLIFVSHFPNAARFF